MSQMIRKSTGPLGNPTFYFSTCFYSSLPFHFQKTRNNNQQRQFQFKSQSFPLPSQWTIDWVANFLCNSDSLSGPGKREKQQCPARDSQDLGPINRILLAQQSETNTFYSITKMSILPAEIPKDPTSLLCLHLFNLLFTHLSIALHSIIVQE